MVNAFGIVNFTLKMFAHLAQSLTLVILDHFSHFKLH